MNLNDTVLYTPEIYFSIPATITSLNKESVEIEIINLLGSITLTVPISKLKQLTDFESLLLT